MAAGWGHALAAAVQGYQNGMAMRKSWDDAEEAKAMKADMIGAAKQTPVEQDGAGGMVKPDTMDNRDVGLAENFQPQASPVGDIDPATGQIAQVAPPANGGLLPSNYSVAGKNYAQDKSGANTAAAALNTPAAVASRQAQVFNKYGRPQQAMALQRDSIQTQAAQGQLDDSTKQRVDAAFDQALFNIQNPQGLATALSGSPAVGGAKVAPVMSDDGKTFQLGKVGDDGAVVPFGQQIPTDAKGFQGSLAQFAKGLSTTQRVAMLQHDQERTQAQSNSDRTFNRQGEQFQQTFDRQGQQFQQNMGMQQRSADRADSTQERLGRLADVQIKSATLAYEQAVEAGKVPQAVVQQNAVAKEELKAIGSAIAKSMAEGTWNAEAPSSKSLLARQGALGMQLRSSLAPYLPKASQTAADPAGRNAPSSGEQAPNRRVIEDAINAEKIDGNLASFVRSIYAQESGSGANTKTSNAGAVGGMQIIPSTFKGVADAGWDINDPGQNARAGVRYAKEAWEKGGGDPKLAGAYYYGGPNGLAKAKKGVAVSDPRNPKAPNTLQYGEQVAARMGSQGGGGIAAQAKAEIAEMNRGTRDQPSPEVLAYLDKTSKAKGVSVAAERQAQGQRDIEEERKRALARSRQIVASN